ncbi:MAG: rhodanese-like domain-containing protein [Deltaproteobacteria bacterium]|nr:rhodanese-like domain-containing protein [Deltaproteobacteria bacterium]
MKKGIIFSLLACLLLALPMQGFSDEEYEMAYPEVSRITAEELKQMIDEEGEYVLVDSRDSMSYDQGHIKGAINIYYDLAGDPVSLEMMLIGLPMDKWIIIYCS